MDLIYMGLLTFQNIVYENVTVTSSVPYLISFIGLGQYVFIDGFTMKNVSMSNSIGINFAGSFPFISISNFEADTVYSDTNSKMINFGLASFFVLSDMTFTNIHSQYDTSINNEMIYVVALDQSTATMSVLQNVQVQSSTIGFLNIKTVQNSFVDGSSLIIQNINYTD